MDSSTPVESRHGSPISMKERLVVVVDAPDTWLDLAGEALEFVGRR